MSDVKEAIELLERAPAFELRDVYAAIASASFNDICVVGEWSERSHGAIGSTNVARRLVSNRKENGLEAAGAIIDKPGLPLMIVLSKSYIWLTTQAA